MGRIYALIAMTSLGWAVSAHAEMPAPRPQAPLEALPTNLLGGSFGKFKVDVPVSLTGRAEGLTGYPLDRYGTRWESGLAFSPRVRVGLKLDSVDTWDGLRLRAEYEHDFVTGTYTLRPAVDGEGMPDTEALGLALRKANVRAQVGEKLLLGAGLMTSHWGLGLMANDGEHRSAATFADPRGGDRVLRAYAGTGPYGKLALAGLLAADIVWDDDVLLTKDELSGGHDSDKAWQAVLAVTAGDTKGSQSAGVYVVHRRQQTADGRSLQVTGLDATARAKFQLAEKTSLELAFEAAFLAGTTDFAATPDYATQDVRQLGVAVRATLDAGNHGLVFDMLFASGDQDTDDSTQNAFRPDPNYEMGLFLYRHVLAAQTGRGSANAGDPDLVGVASQGLERYPTRGSASNTLAFFPRGFWRPIDSLEIYGGPLIALSPVPLADPLNSRVGGGPARNALDGKPGLYLGTELDVGVRWTLVKGVHKLMIGAEGGVFLPRSGFADGGGVLMDPVMGARALVDYRF